MLALTPLVTRAQSHGHSLISSYSWTETGLDTITFDTAQDAQGVLYFAGTSLLTFDGDYWKKTAVPGAFAIRSLSFSPDGRLWAGMIGDIGWFERLPDSNWKFHSLREKLPHDDRNVGEVWGISADSKGTTFVCSDRILRWDGEQFTTVKLKSAKKLFPVRANGEFFVHCAEDGLYEVNASGSQLIIGREILRDAIVLWVERRDSKWLLGTSKGFFRYDGNQLSSFGPEIERFVQAGTLSSACRLPDGRIVVGTMRRGMAFLRPDGSIESTLDDREGLPSPYITSLFVSSDGELWATTSSHILKIDIRARSTVFDARAGLPRQTYRKIAKVGESIYVANESGLYQLPERDSRFVPVESLPGRWQNLQESSGALLVSGFRGTKRWDGDKVETIFPSNFDASASSAVRSNGRDVWVAAGRSIFRISSRKLPEVCVEKLTDAPTSIAEGVDGRLWIGTLAHGLFVATPSPDGPVEAQATAGSLGLPQLVGRTHVRTDPAGTVMIFANNGAWQKPSHMDRFVPVIDFPIRTIASVSEMAADGTVWVALQNTESAAPCVGRISFFGSDARWEPHAVDGLNAVGAPCSIFADAKPDETVLWIGGTHALLRHVVSGQLSDPAPRPPLLRPFARGAANQTRVPIAAALPYSTELLEFEFAAPEFSRRSLLRIETRIDGVDADWAPVAPGSRRELTAIRDGRYTVRARVVAETGATSPETKFSFSVMPPWWRTASGLTTCGFVVALLVFGGFRLRVRTLRLRNAALESKILERTEQLERANAAKTQFVANVSHDIRNPLNGIVGLSLALENTRLDARQQEIVATLRECTTYLSSLVDDVLDFASIEAGRIELRPVAFRPEELLRSIVEMLKADATASGAVLSIEASSRIPETLYGDAGRIQQILVNFVSNALKYAGGDVRLSAHVPATAPGEVEFSVTDRGPGISAEQQATLFTKFSRLRQQRGGEEIPGTGLGLAACRLLADIMSGAVGVESRPGAGARFFLRLPLGIATSPAPAPAEYLPNTSVLLVEDTDYNAWAAGAVLAKLGLICERARTGAEALQLFGTKPFHLVLLDRNLPDMDGTEVARRMRKMESDSPAAVILAVTAYCTTEDRALCLQSGMDAFVGKPLTPEKLRKVLLDAGRRLLTPASVQVSPELPGAAVDLTLLTYLSDGSPDGLEVQIRRFLATLDEAHQKTTAASQGGDFAALAISAHGILGQARMIGYSALAEAATRLEAAAREGDAAACSEWLHRISSEIHSVTAAMRHARPVAQSV